MPDGLQQRSDVDEIGVVVYVCPGTELVFEILHPEFDVGRRPMRLDGGDVGPNDTRAGEVFGHWTLGQLRSSWSPGGRTILGPKAYAGSEVDNLLRVVSDGSDIQLAIQQVVNIQLVLQALAELLRVVVGQAVSALKKALISPNGQSASNTQKTTSPSHTSQPHTSIAPWCLQR